jgi:cytochrome c
METSPLNILPNSSEYARVQIVRVLCRISFIGAALLAASASHAELDVGRAKALLSQNACLGCHAVESRVVGPAYKDVAARYKGGDPAALAARIKSGGSGKWGEIAMPPQAQLSDADTRILATWILAGCPDQ